MNGIASIRGPVADEDTDRDINPKRQRFYPVIDRDTMEWVSVYFYLDFLPISNINYQSVGFHD